MGNHNPFEIVSIPFLLFNCTAALSILTQLFDKMSLKCVPWLFGIIQSAPGTVEVKEKQGAEKKSSKVI